MASSAPTFEQYFEQTPVSAPEPHASEVMGWNTWEAWITFTLVFFVQLPVAGSLQSSNWVDEMPSLVVAGLAGMMAAWALGHMHISRLVAMTAATTAGLVTVTALVLHTMVLIDPAESGALARWSEFRFRLLEWARALFGDGISTDPLPFVFLLVAVVFLVGFISTWAVVRWRNPWVALIPGGIVLLTNISYLPGQPSFSFILFLLAAIMLVTRLSFIEGLIRWRRQGMSPGEGMSIEVLIIGGAVASLLIVAAWTIPTANNWGPIADTWTRTLAPVQERVDRFGQLFIGIASKKPQPVHTMGAVMPLQGRVSLHQEYLYEVQAPEGILLRGAVYDEYTGSGWRASQVAAVPLSGGGVEAAQFGTPSSRQSIREAVRIDVTVLHENAPRDTLLGAGDPIAASDDASLLVDWSGGAMQLRSLAPIPVEGAYSTVATRSVAAADTLADAGQNYPASIVDRYLALPDEYPPEVHALALSITNQAGNPYEAARLIEAYLRTNYTFDLQISAPPPGRDAVEYFLFDSRTGYFDLFASSMSVMLRTVGIPSRVAVGFAPESADYDRATKTYLITEQRAWAWPEVYFPGLGWVEFNPTPTRPAAVRPGDDSAARAAAAELLNPDSNLFFGDDVLDDFMGEGSVDLDLIFGTTDESTDLLARLVGWAIIAATAFLVAVIVARVLWERAFRGLDVRTRRWAKLLWFAARAGLHPLPDRTPSEVAADLAARTGEVEAWSGIARSYARVRYGGPDVEGEDEDAASEQTAHYRQVRAALVRLIFRRLARFGRTPQGALTRYRTAARTDR